MKASDAIVVLGLYHADAKHKYKLQSEYYKCDEMANYWKHHVDAIQFAMDALAKESNDPLNSSV